MSVEEISSLKAANLMAKRVLRIEENATVLDAVQKMYLSNVGAIVIVNNDEKVVGIFSERDILRRVIPKDLKIKKVKVSEVMTKEPTTVSSDTSIFNIYDLMNGLNFRHIPVVDDNVLVGIISIKDIAKSVMKLAKK